MEQNLWWKEALRIIQYNLQVKDTAKMVPEQIAADLKNAAANTVVLNVGGIYAWYHTTVPYHHKNEYLPEDMDLLQCLIDACHSEGIRVIARFDFSKAEDTTYLRKPRWFVKSPDGQPLIFGKDRMGGWSLLVTTCVNGGYRNQEVAVPVLEEVLKRYDVDGIFLNAPQMEDCFCENCRRKYRKYYYKEMPAQMSEWEPGWKSRCLKENIGNMYSAVKAARKEVPVILYYGTYHPDGSSKAENLCEKYETADMVCTEAQDILSAGVLGLPEVWKPLLNMKLGRMEDKPYPCGIIHSCPGMDWRHTGLPSAEYLFWMSQIPAGGGQLWHSLTGFGETVQDKRLLADVSKMNRMAAACEPYMEGTKGAAQILLLWDAGRSALGWVEGLMNIRHPFDLMDIWNIDFTKMRKYEIVIIPDSFPFNIHNVEAFRHYAEDGGKLIVEKTDTENLEQIEELLGVIGQTAAGQSLTASYLRLETAGEVLRRDLELTELLPLRERVLYVEPLPSARRLASLVPPFAPLDGVGAPPERASLTVEQTDIPLLLEREYGRGKILFLGFQLSRLLSSYRLRDHYLLLRNCLDYLYGSEKDVEIDTDTGGIFLNVFRGEDRILLHLINGIGQRPLAGSVDYHDLRGWVKLPEGKEPVEAEAVISGSPISWEIEGRYLKFHLPVLKIWEMISIKWK